MAEVGDVATPKRVAPEQPARVEVIFRKGKPIAAFLHFTSDANAKSGRGLTLRHNVTLHVNERLAPLGLEIALPSQITTKDINEILRDLGQAAITDADLLPLR